MLGVNPYPTTSAPHLLLAPFLQRISPLTLPWRPTNQLTIAALPFLGILADGAPVQAEPREVPTSTQNRFLSSSVSYSCRSRFCTLPLYSKGRTYHPSHFELQRSSAKTNNASFKPYLTKKLCLHPQISRRKSRLP